MLFNFDLLMDLDHVFSYAQESILYYAINNAFIIDEDKNQITNDNVNNFIDYSTKK